MREARRFVPSSAWEDARQVRGLVGERVALAFLTACGWDIEAHRFRWGRHDLDLVARKGSLVAFVEVKTRRSFVCGAPLEAIGYRKRVILARLADVWRLRYGRADDLYRFDVVAVREHGTLRRYDVEHVADAWRCGSR
jgi:putative endonuclease